MACDPLLVACLRRSSRAASTCRIWCMMSRRRSMSRRSSDNVLGGIGSPSGVRKSSRRSASFSELGVEVPDTEPGQGCLHAVDDPGLLADEALALSAGSPGILLRDGRDRGHFAMFPLAAQPAKKGSLQELGVEPVGLGAPVLAWHRHARGMNDVGLDAACLEPPPQPEAVPPGLEGHGDAFDLVSSLLSFLPPPIEQPQQGSSQGSSFFRGWRSTPGMIPATSQLSLLLRQLRSH